MHGFRVLEILAGLRIFLGQGALFVRFLLIRHTRACRAPEPLLDAETHLGGHPVFLILLSLMYPLRGNEGR